MALACYPMTTVTARRKAAEYAAASVPALRIAAPAVAREYRRAPRGGVVVAGRFFRGGCFLPAEKPAAGHALAVDVTRDDFAVAITNPATGNTRHFRVATVLAGKWMGSRVAMVRDDAARDWSWIGWADSFGVRPLARLASDPAVAGPNGYVALLNESGRFAARGIVYSYSTN